jgi:hypothetical protein
MTMRSRAELIEAAYEMTGGNVKDLTVTKLQWLMTVTQFVTDLCLNEIEERGALTYTKNSAVIIPYQCDHMVRTILMRGTGAHEPGSLQHVEGAARSLVASSDDFEETLNAIRQALQANNPQSTDAELLEMFIGLAGFRRPNRDSIRK